MVSEEWAGGQPGAVARSWVSGGLVLSARDYAGAAGPARLPVVCIHGLTRNSRDFADLAPWIAARGRRVLAVDVRGRGRSARDPNPLNYHIFTYASDIVGLLAALGIRHAHIVGTSMGGLTSMALASLRPDLIAGAVLNDVGPEIDPQGLARITDYVGRPVSVRNWEEAAAYVRAQNAAALPGYSDDDWMRMARRLFTENAAGVPVLDYDPDIAVPMRAAAGAASDLWPLWGTLAASRPILVLRGALSDLLTRRTVDLMQATAPHMGFAEIAGVGHAPVLDEPEARAAIGDFLANNP